MLNPRISLIRCHFLLSLGSLFVLTWAPSQPCQENEGEERGSRPSICAVCALVPSFQEPRPGHTPAGALSGARRDGWCELPRHSSGATCLSGSLGLHSPPSPLFRSTCPLQMPANWFLWSPLLHLALQQCLSTRDTDINTSLN